MNDARMSDVQYRAFLDLLMCSDPWPVPDATTQYTLDRLANELAVKRGYANWIEAYHRHLVPEGSRID